MSENDKNELQPILNNPLSKLNLEKVSFEKMFSEDLFLCERSYKNEWVSKNEISNLSEIYTIGKQMELMFFENKFDKETRVIPLYVDGKESLFKIKNEDVLWNILEQGKHLYAIIEKNEFIVNFYEEYSGHDYATQVLTIKIYMED
jgi:hypothetical protein